MENMSKENETKNNNKPMVYDALLASGVYKTENFRINVGKDGSIKVTATKAGLDFLKIEPVSANCVWIHSCS
jgi:hypothetical protein